MRRSEGRTADCGNVQMTTTVVIDVNVQMQMQMPIQYNTNAILCNAMPNPPA